MAFIPENFDVPEKLETDDFRLRGLTMNDAIKDYDAEIYMWVRDSAFEEGLDPILYETVQNRIKTDWPFENPVYPGRAIEWEAWKSVT